MSIIDKLQDPAVWESFFCHKIESGNMDKEEEKDLEAFIVAEKYIPIVERIRRRELFDIPVKLLISKQHSSKKRVVYCLSREENYVMKLLTYLIIRKYDHLFAKNLYSFRANQGVKRAMHFLRGCRDLDSKYVYKVDVHDYFNSVDTSLLMPMLEDALQDDRELFIFLRDILEDDKVLLSDGTPVHESKGIMAGVPISSFLANLYLSQMDWDFYNSGMMYARYSDDIIVFCDSEQERDEVARRINDYLAKMHLEVNPKKVALANPHEKWEFLGISYHEGVFDISQVSETKLKKKMWRKSRALLRWKDRKGFANERAARAFIKAFNSKLYDNPSDSELTWTRWFFPIINTAKSLQDIDHYMLDCIRHINSESRTKKRFALQYSDIKAMGYRSLVHEYYKVKTASAE